MECLLLARTMDLQRMDIQRLPSYESMIVTADCYDNQVHVVEIMIQIIDNVEYATMHVLSTAN